jgi:hypothetical protein
LSIAIPSEKFQFHFMVWTIQERGRKKSDLAKIRPSSSYNIEPNKKNRAGKICEIS